MDLKARITTWRNTVQSRRRDVARRTTQAVRARRRALRHRGKQTAKLYADRLRQARKRLDASTRALRTAEGALDKLRRQQSPLRFRAYKIASELVGVMESGGNNSGAMVMKIIRANGGTGPEPWCGDFLAYCYKLAGSKRVQRAWASVRMLRGLAGISATSHPKTGDMVRFTFDHVGMFVKDNGNGTITTIEGNTGASGAVSDSRTGGDGVYRKIRSKNLVRDYLSVSG